MEEPIDIEETKALLSLLETQTLLDLNEETIEHLHKHGIKLRQFKWTEFSAS